MGTYGLKYLRRLNFAGAETQTITPTSGKFILITDIVMFLSVAAVNITLAVGDTVIFDAGLLNISPVQLDLKEGVGSNVVNDPITVTSTGACEVSIRYIEQ